MRCRSATDPGSGGGGSRTTPLANQKRFFRVFDSGEVDAVSEHVLRILLDELAIIRITCANGQCGGSLELDIDKLKRMNFALTCPGCGAELRKPVVMRGGRDDCFDQLSDAIGAIKSMPGMRCAFILRVKDEE